MGDLMERRRLPGTDLDCSVLGLGTWGLGGPNEVAGIAFGWPDVSEETAHATIRSALDNGINFFDSSDFYGRGRGEERLGRSLKGVKDIAVATKVGIVPRLCEGTDDLQRDFSADHIRRSAEESLRRLHRETIDLYQLHGPGLSVLEHDEPWRALEYLKQSGKIRHVGVSLKSSHMQGASLARWLDNPLVSSVQIEYSVAYPERARSLEALSRRTTIIARSVLGHGMLLRDPPKTALLQRDDHRIRKWDDAKAARVHEFSRSLGDRIPKRNLLELLLRFAVDAPSVSVALVGATSPAQVRQLATAARNPTLSAEERAHLFDAASANFAT
jgi:aryl-alcohol dehydrogenase-like predicted oxidoreductase